MLNEPMSAPWTLRSKRLLGRKSSRSRTGLCKHPYNVRLCVSTWLLLCLPQCSVFGEDNGPLWTPPPCHAKGVTCVCHKWALVWLIALWMSPVQPFSARRPLAVVCIVFLPLAEAAAADFLTKKEKELLSPWLQFHRCKAGGAHN